MDTTTARAPRPDPLAPYLTAVAEQFADPATPEDVILGYGLRGKSALDAVMPRPNKSPALVSALIERITRGPHLGFRTADAMLTALLHEPALTAQHLEAMTWGMLGRTCAGPGIIMAVAAHPAAGSEITIKLLWAAPRSAVFDVAATTGGLLPAVIWWVRGQRDRGELAGHGAAWRIANPSELQGQAINEVAARWAAQIGDDTGLASFMATAAFFFTAEEPMFAAARAILAPPSATC